MLSDRQKQKIIDDFVAEICPEAPRLYMASFNEMQCLKDATQLIRELRAEISAIHEAIARTKKEML
jgi:hypothetical protein